MNPQKMVKPVIIATVALAALVIVGLPLGYLAFTLLILACPLMMYFMMRGMDHGNSSDSHDRGPQASHDQSAER